MTLRPGLLVLAAVPLLLLSHAQSMVVASGTADVCLPLDLAKQFENNRVVICGFPPPESIGSSPEVPFACHRKTDNILGLLSSQSGLQTLTAKNICYQSFVGSTYGATHTTLSSDIVASRYGSPMQVRLLASVAELVGTTQILSISGRGFSAINPEIFSAIGPCQKETLIHLVLHNTSITSIDLALLEPLGISDLVLVDNALLSRITNSKSVTLPSLKELVIWNGNKSLLECRSFSALPAGLTAIYLVQEDIEGICALCFLPKSVTKVFVNETQGHLPFHPSVVGTASTGRPFPLDKLYARIENIPPPEPLKEFLVTPTTATGCQPNCSCQADPTMSASSTVTEVYIVVLVALIIFGIFL